MGNNLTLAEQIQRAKGKNPTEIDTLDTIASSALTNAETDHTVNAIFDNAELKAALDALGAKINAIIALL